MDLLRFATCITLPGITASDIVNAALKNSVHILDKQIFDPSNDYTYYSNLYGEADVKISHLFVFPGGSILSENEDAFRAAILQLKQL